MPPSRTHIWRGPSRPSARRRSRTAEQGVIPAPPSRFLEGRVNGPGGPGPRSTWSSTPSTSSENPRPDEAAVEVLDVHAHAGLHVEGDEVRRGVLRSGAARRRSRGPPQPASSSVADPPEEQRAARAARVVVRARRHLRPPRLVAPAGSSLSRRTTSSAGGRTASGSPARTRVGAARRRPARPGRASRRTGSPATSGRRPSTACAAAARRSPSASTSTGQLPRHTAPGPTVPPRRIPATSRTTRCRTASPPRAPRPRARRTSQPDAALHDAPSTTWSGPCSGRRCSSNESVRQRHGDERARPRNVSGVGWRTPTSAAPTAPAASAPDFAGRSGRTADAGRHRAAAGAAYWTDTCSGVGAIPNRR